VTRLLDEMSQAFHRLSELRGVDCLGGEVVCEEEDGGVGEAVFDVGEELEVAWSYRHDIAAAWSSRQLPNKVYSRQMRRTVEPQDNLFRRAAAEPMRLCAARQCDALGYNAVILAPLEIYGRRGAVHVALLCRVEVAELDAHHAEHDVFEVVVRARGAFEGGDP
jgi:hypothetical protein